MKSKDASPFAGTSGPRLHVLRSSSPGSDLDRLATFLHEQSPDLAAVVAHEIIARAQLLSRHPRLGRPISTREEYRQIVMQVLGAADVFQYRDEGNRIVMLRVFHGREAR